MRPFFSDEQTSEIDETFLRLFTPPKDANGDYDKVQCFEVFKRIVFKLAAAFERVYLFTQDRVRARSYNLEVCEADIQDAFKLTKEVSPFRRSQNELAQRNEEVKMSIVVAERRVSVLN